MTERERMNNAVESLGIPVLDEFIPLVYPSVYVDTFKQEAGLFGSGTESESKGYVKIHIWSKKKEECDTLKEGLKKALKENGIYAGVEKMDDPSASIFRYVLTIEILEEEDIL